MMGTSNLNHALGEVNARHPSTSVMELFGQIPGATACVEHRAPIDVACECPQHGVSIQDAVTVSLITHLNPPIIRYAVPEIAGFFQLAVTHRSVSRRMRSVSRCWKPERSGRWRMLPTSECSAARGCHTLLSEHTLLLSHQHREHQHHERHEMQHGACRMREFPLATQFDPI